MFSYIANILHRTPWWVLVVLGLGTLVFLGVFATPIKVIQLERSGDSAEMNRAIKHEIGSALGESALGVAEKLVRAIHQSAGDPESKRELERALKEIEEARKDIRSIVADLESPQSDIKLKRDKVDKELADNAPSATQAPAKVAKPPAQRSPAPDAPAAPETPALEPLSPELREDIRNKVTQGIYRLGIGSAMILLFIPLFIILIVSKIFIDRARAALRMAELRKKEAEYHNMNRQITEAKLQALQAQVEPHFLYNTLASVQALTESDPPSANKMIEHLILYLRSALPKMRETTSTVGQEMELVRAYLNILKMRMGTRLEFDIALAPHLIHEPFPPLMLPSLVENAIKHGLEPLREGGRIDIAARLENGKLTISVRDNGKGLGGGASSGGGIGLANVRERLQALFGDAGRLVIEENTPHGVIASIEIPHGVSASGSHAPIQSLHTRVAAQAINLGEKNEPKSWWRRLISALATTERVWRRVLSWTFALYVAAVALACVALLAAIYSGSLPVTLGTQDVHSIEAMGIATLGVLLLFVVLVMTGALLTAVGYGLGALFLALLIFVPLVTIAGMAPVLVPLAIVVFGVWWWLRRGRQRQPGDNH